MNEGGDDGNKVYRVIGKGSEVLYTPEVLIDEVVNENLARLVLLYMRIFHV